MPIPFPLPGFADADALEPYLRLLAKVFGGLEYDAKGVGRILASVAPQWLGQFHAVHAIALQALRSFFIDPQKMTKRFLLKLAA